MGFRDNIKSGGGFLNQVDGVITGYQFTTTPPGEGAEESEWLYLVPSIRQDGASEDVTQHFFMGAAERYTISKDGKTLSSATDDGEIRIGATTPTGRLLTSILDNQGDTDIESELPDLAAGEDLNLDALVNLRVRFVQEKDEEGTKKRGQRKDPKTGKKYDRTNTVVSAVYGRAEAKRAASSGKNGHGAVAAKGKGKQAEPDLTEEADAVLCDVLADAKDHQMVRGKLSLPLTKKLMKNAHREDLKKLIMSEAFLEREEGWTYDAKSEVIEAA